MAEITKQQSPILPEDGSGSNDFDSMFALVLESGSRDNPSELDPVGISGPWRQQQSGTPLGELWFRYRYRRRSADDHMKHYLDCRGKVLRSYIQSLCDGNQRSQEKT